MPTTDEFLKMNGRELLDVLRAGKNIDPTALEGYAYKGISLGLPEFVDKLAWKTFQKTFFRDPASGHLRGWNVRLEQRGIDAKSVPLQAKGVPVTFGHYHVVPYDVPVPKAPGLAGLLIHYGKGGNSVLDPMHRMRDPIVALEEGNADRLLGWSYADLGFTRVGTPSFFLLEREHPIDYVAPAPN